MDWPSSDLSGSNIRPAIVIAALDEDSYILCQVTSQSYHEAAIELNDQDFESGSLKKKSFILYTQLFTANSTVIHGCYASVRKRYATTALKGL